MRIIALEEHWWSKELFDVLKAVTGEWYDDSMKLFDIDRFGGRDIERSIEDVGTARLADMRESGVDMQVLSVGPPATQSLPASQAVPLARELNDRIAAAVQVEPEHFAAFATLPTPDPRAAVAELERAVTELGMVGALINGRTRDRLLDDPTFDDIFAAAAALHVPIYIHPQLPVRAVRDAYYSGFTADVNLQLASGAWGWHMETGLTALRLILRGTFDRYPDLNVVLGHWGDMLPYWLERVDGMSGSTGLQRPISDYIRKNIYVTPSGMFQQQLLHRSIGIVGVDHIMYSTDYPLRLATEGGARRFLAEAVLDDDSKHLIAHGTAERLLRLPAVS